MPKKIIIVGGGVAGLTAAAALASRGVSVSLFESRPFLGGRIYSFHDPATKDYIDNGQHVFAGFYRDTFRLLSIVGSAEYIVRQRRLTIDFLEKGGGKVQFFCPRLPSPLQIFYGLFKYPKFPRKDFWKLIASCFKMRRPEHSMNAAGYLLRLGQSNEAIEVFFRPLILATLNAEPEEVSARLFHSMLKKILSAPAAGSGLAYSQVGFSELIAEPAASYIIGHGGDIYHSTRIAEIKENREKVEAVIDQNGREHRAGAYIMALPPSALSKIVPEGSLPNLDTWRYSPIVSVNIWYDRLVKGPAMAGLLGGNFQWYFDKSAMITGKEKHRYVTLLASSAHDKINLPKEKLIEQAIGEMYTYVPASRSAKIVKAQVIKEKRATVLITPEMEGKRASALTKWPNLFLAGDWIDSGMPATVESAAGSGFAAAECAAEIL